MAEPARRLEDPEQKQVYDEAGSAASNPKPDLKSLEGGSETTERKHDRLREAKDDKPSRDQLSEAEENDNPEHENTVGHGYKSSKPVSRKKGIIYTLFGTGRRKAASGGVIGFVLAAIIFLLTIASGPLQFIHLSQILQRNFFHSQTTVQIRNKGLFRYARTGNVEETRLGKLGSTVYGRTLSQLHDQGIDFHRNSRGVPDLMTIDASKNDNYKDLSQSEQKTAILQDYQITDERILTQNGSHFTINLDSTSLKGIDFVKATSKTAIGSLGNGKIETGLAFRYLKQAWDLPRLFSPLDKAKSVTLNKFASVSAEKQAADQAEEERVAQEEVAVLESPELGPVKDKIKSVFEDNQGKIVAAVTGQLFLCTVRSAANDAIILNRAAVVLPATIQATDKIAVGSQVQSGNNFDAIELEAVANSFVDSQGHNIWQGKALQATEGINDPSGPDLPAKYGQAFSGDTTANAIRQAISINVFGLNITNLACSKIAQYISAIATLGVLASGFFDGGTSWAGYASVLGEQAAYVVATAGVIYLIQHNLTDILSDKAAIPAVLSGPLGGNLMAFGARELSNVGARSMGGVAMDNTNTTVLGEADAQQYNQQFKAEPVAKRLFDVYDSRSAVSKLIDNVNPNLQNMASGLGGLLTNFGSMFSHSFSAIMPHALAASQPYNWGFPKYGFTDDLAQNPDYEDPYANGDYVAKNLLDTNASDSHGMEYTDKAMACFGVSISKDSTGVWSVVAQKDVNPDTDEYAGGHCNDSDTNWLRLRLFVADSRLMDGVACHQGMEDACANLDEQI